MYLVEVPQVGSGFATREGPLRGGSFRETTAWSSLYKQLQNVPTLVTSVCQYVLDTHQSIQYVKTLVTFRRPWTTTPTLTRDPDPDPRT